MPDNDEMKFLELTDFGLTVGAAPKIASSTLHVSLRQHYGYDSVSDIPQVKVLRPKLVTGRTFVWTRDPFERFVSLWRNKCVGGGRIIGHDLAGMTPDELFEYTLSNDNHHWLPVSHLLRNFTQPYALVPLDSLALWWEEALPGVERIDSNTTEHIEVPFQFNRMHEFNERYKADDALHTKALVQWRLL